ncbi:hypothetical protein KIPB_014432, partial [Kipferlia bialata]
VPLSDVHYRVPLYTETHPTLSFRHDEDPLCQPASSLPSTSAKPKAIVPVVKHLNAKTRAVRNSFNAAGMKQVHSGTTFSLFWGNAQKAAWYRYIW